MFNLNRYQSVADNISDADGFNLKIVQRHMQKHVSNKPYSICRFQKNILENFQKWPPKTYFKIEEVEEIVKNIK